MTISIGLLDHSIFNKCLVWLALNCKRFMLFIILSSPLAFRKLRQGRAVYFLLLLWSEHHPREFYRASFQCFFQLFLLRVIGISFFCLGWELSALVARLLDWTLKRTMIPLLHRSTWSKMRFPEISYSQSSDQLHSRHLTSYCRRLLRPWQLVWCRVHRLFSDKCRCQSPKSTLELELQAMA